MSPGPAVRVERSGGRSLVECQSRVGTIEDALELVSLCIENGADRLLCEARQLPEAFFDLRSGFAGEFLQKLQNYGIRFAAILPDSERQGPRFQELLLEANRGNDFRTFERREDAEDWLSK